MELKYEIFPMLNALGGPTNHGDTPMGPPGECGTRAEDPGVHYHFQGVIKQPIIKHKLLVCISLGFLFIQSHVDDLNDLSFS